VGLVRARHDGWALVLGPPGLKNKPTGCAWAVGKARSPVRHVPRGTTCRASPTPIGPCLSQVHAVLGRDGLMAIYTDKINFSTSSGEEPMVKNHPDQPARATSLSPMCAFLGLVDKQARVPACRPMNCRMQRGAILRVFSIPLYLSPSHYLPTIPRAGSLPAQRPPTVPGAIAASAGRPVPKSDDDEWH